MAVDLTLHALTTLAEAKTEMGVSGVTDDDYISRVINASSDVVRRFCDRVFYFEADIEEYVPGYGDTNMLLSRTPIDSITSISYEGTALDSDSYSIKSPAGGSVYRQCGFVWTAQRTNNILFDSLPGTEKHSYLATYDGGYKTPQQVIDDGTISTRDLPYDLEDACLQLVTSRYRAKGRDPRVSAERLMSWQATYGMATTDRSHTIPLAVQEMLAPYKRFTSV